MEEKTFAEKERDAWRNHLTRLMWLICDQRDVKCDQLPEIDDALYDDPANRSHAGKIELAHAILQVAGLITVM